MPTQRLTKFAFVLLILFGGCGVLQTFENFSRLKFKINSAVDYKIAGVLVEGKKSLKDFRTSDALKISGSALKGQLPISFILNIEAQNPNDGSGGYPATDLTLQSFPWRLFINDNETISGNIEKPIVVPGKGGSSIIPIRIEFDLAENMKNKNFDDILALALNLAGIQKSASNLKLLVQPVIGTPIGNVKFPNEITVIEKQFN